MIADSVDDRILAEFLKLLAWKFNTFTASGNRMIGCAFSEPIFAFTTAFSNIVG